jgi:hypothetical protein
VLENLSNITPALISKIINLLSTSTISTEANLIFRSEVARMANLAIFDFSIESFKRIGREP